MQNQIIDNFRIISMTPCTPYYSKHFKCHRLAQLISVATEDDRKFNIKIYPPFSHNSLAVGDKVRICYVDKQCTDVIKQPGCDIHIKYYQAKSVEPIHTCSFAPYATREELQALRIGYMSFDKLAELHNQWQSYIIRQNAFLLKYAQQKQLNTETQNLPQNEIIFSDKYNIREK